MSHWRIKTTWYFFSKFGWKCPPPPGSFIVINIFTIFSQFVFLRVNFLWLWRRNVVIFPLINILFTLLCYYCPFEEVCSCSLKLCFVPCSVEIGLLAPKEIRFFKITQILCSYVSYFFFFFCTDRLQINNTIKRWQCKPNTWSYGTIASFSNSRYRSNAPKPHSRTHAITLTHQSGSRTLVFALKHHRLVPETSLSRQHIKDSFPNIVYRAKH